MMNVKIARVGDWAIAKKALSADLQAHIKTALAYEAEFLADAVRTRFKKGPHAKLSPFTIASRRLQGFRGTKPLFRRGDMFNSIKATPGSGGTEYFVGVSRRARGKNGKPMANLADVHERGRTIVLEMTPKMRAFLGVLMSKMPPGSRSKAGAGASKTGILVIRIPARPFVGPVFEELGPTSLDRFAAHLTELLEGSLGTV